MNNNNEQPESLWQVGPCVQFNGGVSLGVRAVLQILIGYSCSVHKAAGTTCLRALFIDAAPARPTDWLLSHCGWWLTSPPSPIHWELIIIEWTYSGYRLQLTCRPQSRWLRVSTVVKRSSIAGPGVYCTVVNSPQARKKFSILRNSFEYREIFLSWVSRVSLTSLVCCWHYVCIVKWSLFNFVIC